MSSLQKQLASIAANSNHELDLKAQKTAHSKSLLFDPQHAATQSFENIYQICVEGFEELCALDSRFVAFAKSIFSPQSKSEDRTQMTQSDNQELDRILEAFLGLVGSRLLLKPALKAVEWLVRRFRCACDQAFVETRDLTSRQSSRKQYRLPHPNLLALPYGSYILSPSLDSAKAIITVLSLPPSIRQLSLESAEDGIRADCSSAARLLRCIQ